MTADQIDIATHDGTPTGLDDGLLANLLADLLRSESAEGAVSCVIADDATLQTLNRDYRDTDRPTDVLSFVLAEDTDTFPQDAVLGEIYISRERAAEQARDAGRSLQEEIVHLALHGALHLAGHEHDTDDGHARMTSTEMAYLDTWRRSSKIDNPLTEGV